MWQVEDTKSKLVDNNRIHVYLHNEIEFTLPPFDCCGEGR